MSLGEQRSDLQGQPLYCTPAQPTGSLRGGLVQEPEREIDREPELKKLNSLLLGDLDLGRQDQGRAGRRACIHEEVQAPTK